MKEDIKDKLKGLAPGGLAGFLTRIHIHEPGHWLAWELLVENNEKVATWHEIKFENLGITGGHHPNAALYKPGTFDYEFYDNIVSASGCAFNYLAALASGTMARFIDKENHKFAKSAVTGFSLFNSVYPFCYAALDLAGVYPPGGGDFTSLGESEISPEASLLTTGTISAALLYYNYKGWKDTVKDKTKRMYYNDTFFKNRKNWKEKKKEVTGEFEDYFEDYEPTLGDRIKSKVLRKEPSEIKAKRAWKKLNKIEFSEDYNQRHLKKLSKELDMELENTEEIVNNYLWNHDEDFQINK